MTAIESEFLIWASRGLLMIVGGLGTWLAVRLWNKAHDDIPKELASIRNDFLNNSGTFATKKTVMELDRRLDEKLANSDKQRMAFHDENRQKLNEISHTTKAIFTHSLDLVRINERVSVLEKRSQYMDEWKHETIDPYIPRAVDDLERRINKLESVK